MIGFFRFLFDVRALSLLLLAAAVLVLTAVYISQFVFHYDPCPLCLYQRKPYFAVIALSFLAALSTGRHPCLARGFLWACVFALLTGAGIASYHVGVEQGWWAGLDACAGQTLPVGDVEALRAYLANRKVVRCDVPTWELFGLSMAAYNVMTSFVLAAGTAAVLVVSRRHQALSSSLSQ